MSTTGEESGTKDTEQVLTTFRKNSTQEVRGGIQEFKDRKVEVEALTPEETKVSLESCDEHYPIYYYPFFQTALLTGLSALLSAPPSGIECSVPFRLLVFG